MHQEVGAGCPGSLDGLPELLLSELKLTQTHEDTRTDEDTNTQTDTDTTHTHTYERARPHTHACYLYVAHAFMLDSHAKSTEVFRTVSAFFCAPSVSGTKRIA